MKSDAVSMFFQFKDVLGFRRVRFGGKTAQHRAQFVVTIILHENDVIRSRFTAGADRSKRFVLGALPVVPFFVSGSRISSFSAMQHKNCPFISGISRCGLLASLT